MAKLGRCSKVWEFSIECWAALELCAAEESGVSGRPREINANRRKRRSVRSDDRRTTGWASCWISWPSGDASKLVTRCSSSPPPPALEWVLGSPLPLRDTLIESSLTSSSQKSEDSLACPEDEAFPFEFLLIAPVTAPLTEDFLESLLVSSDSLPWWGKKWLGKYLANEIRVSTACLEKKIIIIKK